MEKYGSKKNADCALEIVGFPCNQFGHQEPGESYAEIMNSLKYVRPGKGFVPAFPLYEKIDVNGRKEDSLFTWLKAQCPRPNDLIVKSNSALWNPIKRSDISWNFEKFLIDDNGIPQQRFSEESYPLQFEQYVDKLQKRCLARRKYDDVLVEEDIVTDEY